MGNRKISLGITLGDPQGIGPEVIQKALPHFNGQFQPVIYGNPSFFDWKNAKKLTPKDCGYFSGRAIEQATRDALEGKIDAIVTGPICKKHLQLAGYPYPGHTEFLADLSHTKKFRMMMAGPKLKVVLVTIHEPIAKISKLLTTEKIFDTIALTHHSLVHWFGIKKPKIAVAALNPHAGESGLFGHEEKKIILPAIQRARKRKWNISEPLSPDTVFFRAVQGDFDAVVCMYHDQGLIPLKLLHFDEGINITLGLPFIRTSVDHGTAFDIAGKNIANPSSMIAAINTAIQLTS